MAQDIKFPRLNHIILSGRLTREVELRYTPKGTPVAKMNVAFNTVYRNNEGNWIEESHFLGVQTFGQNAEDCAAKLHKGSPVIVEGSINTYSFTTNENQQVKVVQVDARRVQNLEKQYYSEHESSESNEPPAKNKKDDSFEDQSDNQITDDDVPF